MPEPPLPKGGWFWLARADDGTPCGYAAGTPLPDSSLVLGPVWVHPDHRRGGVGEALLAEIQKWAEGARVPVLEVSVAAANEVGIRFLEAAGYLPRRVLMSRKAPQ